MLLRKVPRPPILVSPPPLPLPHTIHYHQHIHRMKERLAGFKQSLGCNFTAIYQFILLHLSPIFNLLIYFMKEQIAKFKRYLWCNFTVFYHFPRLCLGPFCNLLIYLLFTSFMGFLVLKALRIRNPQEAPRDIDMFFTAVSAVTLSSLSTVEMEVFSNSQLIVLTILMLLGGEAVTSLLGLQFKRLSSRHNISLMDQNLTDFVHPIEDIELKPNSTVVMSVVADSIQSDMPERNKEMKYTATLCLSYVVLGYLLVMHIGGTVAIIAYLYSVSDARRILREKGLNIITFSVFATVSSFSNCGFIPTNENMIVFKKHLGLLLLVVPQSLLGGVMYPPALRTVLWFLKRIMKKNKFEYILRDREQISYDHLFPELHSLMLALTVLGILFVQFVAICTMTWRNVESEGLTLNEKLVNYLFLAVNTRYTGESTVDLSTLTAAVLVLFIFMMYLPPYTTFIPFKDEGSNEFQEKKDEGSNTRAECSRPESMSFFRIVHLPQLSYLVIFVIVICITERDKIPQDPHNFNIFNIVFEVVSAYGNVGYSMGYSCSRRLTTDGACQDSWTSFAGRWSTSGKVILIVVMLFGRLKIYNMRGGKTWKLRCKN